MEWGSKGPVCTRAFSERLGGPRSHPTVPAHFSGLCCGPWIAKCHHWLPWMRLFKDIMIVWEIHMAKYPQTDCGIRHPLSRGVGFSKEWTTHLTIETWKSLEAGSIFRDWYENYDYLSKVRNWGHLYGGTSCEMLTPWVPIIWFGGSRLLHFSGF